MRALCFARAHKGEAQRVSHGLAGISAAGDVRACRRTCSMILVGERRHTCSVLRQGSQAKVQRASHNLDDISAAGYARTCRRKRSVFRTGSQAYVQQASRRLACPRAAGFSRARRHAYSGLCRSMQA